MDETFQEQPVLTFEPFADEPSASLQKAEPAQAPTSKSPKRIVIESDGHKL